MSTSSEASAKGSLAGGAAVASANDQAAANAGIAIAMFCVLLVSYILMAADRYLFPVLAADIRKAFGFSLQTTGLLSTIFTLGLGLGGLPTGYLLTRFSRKTVLLIGIAIFSGATALTTTAVGFFSMLVLLAAQGIGMSMLATSMFALAANYFSSNRAAAIGSVNFCYGIGGFLGPFHRRHSAHQLQHLARANAGLRRIRVCDDRGDSGHRATLVQRDAARRHDKSRHWRRRHADQPQHHDPHGAEPDPRTQHVRLPGPVSHVPAREPRITRRRTPARSSASSESARWAPSSEAGSAISSRRKLVLSGSLLSVAVLGYLFYNTTYSMLTREILTCIYGFTGSAVLYVNLAGFHVKSLRRSLSSRGSGMFVTSLYLGGAFGGYVLGALAAPYGWLAASEIEMSLLCVIGAVLALGINPSEMSV